MKLVMLMYLSDDDDCVEGLLEEHDVRVFSNLPLEGMTTCMAKVDGNEGGGR